MDRINSIAKPIEISKELENVNFQQLLVQFPELKKRMRRNSKIVRHVRKKLKQWTFNKKVGPNKIKKDNEPKTQLIAFQEAMKLLYIIGQCLGLNSIEGVLTTDVSKMRFSIFSWRFVYCVTIGIVQGILTVFSIYWISTTSLTIEALGYWAFYQTTCITTFLYLHLDRKWPELMRELAKYPLNEYIDRFVKLKCYLTCSFFFIFAAVEHIFSIIPKLTSIVDCSPDIDFYEEFHRQTFNWYYDLGLPHNKVMMVFIQTMNILSTITWSYVDVYIVCISLFLVSILKQINKKIIVASKQFYLPSTYWKSLREDYCKVTRLVRAFDDVIDGLVFVSFASNLFFICLQIYNILGHIFQNNITTKNNYANTTVICEHGKTVGVEYMAYVMFSLLFILARSLTVSLTAARVHSASAETAAALYNVPSSSFCPEIARFLDQVHSNKVAISGLKFFYVTKELVLSVAGTIVTYELVMLQVSAVKTE